MKVVPEGIDRHHCEAVKNRAPQSNRKSSRERMTVLTQRWNRHNNIHHLSPPQNPWSSLLLLVPPTFPQTPGTFMSFPQVSQLPARLHTAFFVQFPPFHYYLFSGRPFPLTETAYRNPEFCLCPQYLTFLPIFHITIRFILLKYNFDYVTLLFKKHFS